ELIEPGGESVRADLTEEHLGAIGGVGTPQVGLIVLAGPGDGACLEEPGALLRRGRIRGGKAKTGDGGGCPGGATVSDDDAHRSLGPDLEVGFAAVVSTQLETQLVKNPDGLPQPPGGDLQEIHTGGFCDLRQRGQL